MKKLKPILALLLLSYCISSYSQTLKYDVLLLGKKIGTTTVQKATAGSNIQYTLTSHTEVPIVGKKDDMFTKALFTTGGKLLSSNYDEQKAKDHMTTKITAQGGKLLIDKDGTKSTTTDGVVCSSLTVFFTEPKNQKKLFSERLGQYMDIVKDGDGVYKVAYNDYTAVYTYKAGKLTELEMKESIGSVVMKLVP